MRTGCDPPPVDRAAFALPAGTPPLLPLKRCQPPDWVADAVGDVAWIPAAGVDGVVCGKPALGPPDVVTPLLLNGRAPEVAAAERVIAWRCCSKDT